MMHFSARYLDIHWVPEGRHVWMQWKDFARSAEYRDGLERGLALVKERRAEGWLADLRMFGVVSKADQVWASEDLFPRIAAAGVKRMALLVPKDVLAKMAVEEILSHAAKGEIVTRHFDELLLAQRWLVSGGAA